MTTKKGTLIKVRRALEYANRNLSEIDGFVLVTEQALTELNELIEAVPEAPAPKTATVTNGKVIMDGNAFKHYVTCRKLLADSVRGR